MGLYIDKPVEDGHPDQTLGLTPLVANTLAKQFIKCGLINGWGGVTASTEDIILYIVQQLLRTLRV